MLFVCCSKCESRYCLFKKKQTQAEPSEWSAEALARRCSRADCATSTGVSSSSSALERQPDAERLCEFLAEWLSFESGGRLRSRFVNRFEASLMRLVSFGTCFKRKDACAVSCEASLPETRSRS